MGEMIRKAVESDRDPVLKFCQNTFSWGDYVGHVWDHWIKEGDLLVFESKSPAGICHALTSKGQLWIEGIRVFPHFRRQGIASKLVKFAEQLGLDGGASLSFMLVDAKNTPSLNLANLLGYRVFEDWNFYSLQPKPTPALNMRFDGLIDPSLHKTYVQSWRWLPLDAHSKYTLSSQNRLVRSSHDDPYSLAVLTESEHFEGTLTVTLFSGSDDAIVDLLSYVQNYAQKNGFQRIHVLTREKLLRFDSLNYHSTFCLLKKTLS